MISIKEFQKEFSRDLIISDIGAVLRGLSSKEHFLDSFEISYNLKVIVCHSVQEFSFITFLPYLYKELQGKIPDEELYSVYVEVSPNKVALQGMCSFIDVRFQDDVSFGFDFKMYHATFLGVYYPSTNEFKNGGKDL